MSRWRVFHSLAEVPADFGPSALTIGNFDGLHLGHQRLLHRVVEIARQHNWTPSLLTFDPHPTKIVAPARAPKLLSSMEERLALAQQEGIEQALVLPFDEEVRLLSPEAFVRQILRDKLHAKAILVGDNFRFGHKQAGDIDRLAELGAACGFGTYVVPGVQFRGRMVSSSVVRELIGAGEVARACRMLRRPYALRGEVVSGHGIGSKQTVPTLNLRTEAEVLPGDGVYVTSTRDLDDGRMWPSITNVGMRPTFEGNARTVESFLLEPLTGETPKRIEVQFHRWVRGEQKFADAASLKQQILRDVSRAQAYHRRAANLTLIH